MLSSVRDIGGTREDLVASYALIETYQQTRS